MERREKLLEEREQLNKENNKRHKIWMDAFNKKTIYYQNFTMPLVADKWLRS
jgi:hypothetical protein